MKLYLNFFIESFPYLISHWFYVLNVNIDDLKLTKVPVLLSLIQASSPLCATPPPAHLATSEVLVSPPRSHSSAVSHLSVELVSDMRCQCSISFFTIFSLRLLGVGEGNMSNMSSEIHKDNSSF